MESMEGTGGVEGMDTQSSPGGQEEDRWGCSVCWAHCLIRMILKMFFRSKEGQDLVCVCVFVVLCVGTARPARSRQTLTLSFPSPQFMLLTLESCLLEVSTTRQLMVSRPCFIWLAMPACSHFVQTHHPLCC